MVLPLPLVCSVLSLGSGVRFAAVLVSVVVCPLFVLAVAPVPLSLLLLVYALECVSPNDHACGLYISLQVCQLDAFRVVPGDPAV
jgi:hypothetical protein